MRQTPLLISMHLTKTRTLVFTWFCCLDQLLKNWFLHAYNIFFAFEYFCVDQHQRWRKEFDLFSWRMTSICKVTSQCCVGVFSVVETNMYVTILIPDRTECSMSWRIWWPGNSVSDNKVRTMLGLEDSFSFCWGIIRDFIFLAHFLSSCRMNDKGVEKTSKPRKKQHK